MRINNFKCADCGKTCEGQGNNFILNDKLYDLCPQCEEKWDEMIEKLGDGREGGWAMYPWFMPVPYFTFTPFQITPIPYCDEYAIWYDNGTGNACPINTKIESKTV